MIILSCCIILTLTHAQLESTQDQLCRESELRVKADHSASRARQGTQELSQLPNYSGTPLLWTPGDLVKYPVSSFPG